MTNTSTATMHKEADMMDRSNNHVWAEKVRALVAERDALAAENERLKAQAVKVKPMVEWDYYPIVMPLTEDGQGPADIGKDAASLTWEVWERHTLQSMGSHAYLIGAIDHALELSGFSAIETTGADKVWNAAIEAAASVPRRLGGHGMKFAEDAIRALAKKEGE